MLYYNLFSKVAVVAFGFSVFLHLSFFPYLCMLKTGIYGWQVLFTSRDDQEHLVCQLDNKGLFGFRFVYGMMEINRNQGVYHVFFLKDRPVS